LLVISFLFLATQAQAQYATCTGVRFYAPIFANVDSTIGVQFGQNTTVGGVTQDLLMDIYEPQGDTASRRPVIVLAFGGSFTEGTRKQLSELCINYARYGYVAATIDYRIIDDIFQVLDTAALASVVAGAASDMKAAIRFFREDAATSNVYKVNPDFIAAGGISSGAIAALNTAYVDSVGTLPAFVKTALDQNGGFDGNSSANTQYSFQPQAVISFSGALNDVMVMDADDPPLYMVHDDQDDIVPFGSKTIPVSFLYTVFLEGSQSMYTRLQALGVKSSLVVIPNSPAHVSYFGDPNSQFRDSVFNASVRFIANEYCGQTVSVKDKLPPQSITVYPNPAEGNVYVGLGEIKGPLSIEVIDPMGRVRKANLEREVDEWEIEENWFSPGLNLVRITGPGIASPVTKKIIHQ
ncbi:MAG: esterase, partial [Bacteroidota bacterium]